MRKIKFRFYSEVHNKMISWDKINKNHLHHYLSGKNDNIKSMQFTGLKDKNRKEIYEGDIIKTINGNWGVVVVKDHAFEVTVSESQSSLYMADWMRQSEVIGNIYETPELLMAADA